MRRRVGACTFLRHSFYFFRLSAFSFPVAIISVAACLTAAALFAQQNPAAKEHEPANLIRLREQWFYQQRAYPHKHIPPGARFKAFQQLRKMQAAQRSASQLEQQTTSSTAPSTSRTIQAKALSTTSWTEIGPQPTATPFAFNPVSGRVTALAVDPTNANVVYLGGAEGGVWKTTDGGTTWTPLTDNQPSLAVGSIAIDPENPQTIYVGTGEENFNFDAYFGAGILKSTDGGSTWTTIGTGPQSGPYGLKPYFYGGYVGSIAVDPQSSQVLLAAVNEVSDLWGVWRSSDGGQTWTQVETGLATSVLFDPSNGGTAYATFAGGGVYKSTDAGLTWTADNGTGTNVLNATNSFRISVAIDPRNTSTLYASVTSLPDATSGSTVLGFYKTTDGGANWTALWTPTAATSPTFPAGYCDPAGEPGQCWYDSVLAIDPATSSIFIGGSFEGQGPGVGSLWRSQDGGLTWSDIDPPPTTSGVQALHPDLHAIAFAPDGSRMYVGTDGGLWSTLNVATSPVTWTNLNAPLALTQFYPGMSVAPYDSNFTLGGTQDNGTQYYSDSLTWQMITCGDGAETAIDPSGSGIVYTGCIYAPGPSNQNFLLKFTPSGGWAASDSGINGSDPGEFIPPLAIDPSNPQTLYFGTYRVYQSMNGGETWNAISGSLSFAGQGPLTAIAVAPSDSNTVYAGSDDGYVAGTFNAEAGTGATWQEIGYAAGLPTFRYITALEVDPQNAKNVYATLSGYCLSGTSTCPSGSGHVFEFTSASGVWNDLSGNLPDVPVNDIAVDPDITNTIYVATDVGVFVGTNTGSGWQWAPLGTGLPAVAVLSLKLQHASRILRAASHGRSAWDIQLPAPAGATAVFSVPNLTFPLQQVGTTSAAQNVIVTNNGSSTLNITSIAASGDFGETNTCGTSLASGSNCTISVTFTPTTFGSRTGTVTITDNAASGTSQIIGLTGTAFSGAVSLSPTSLSFGNQLVGATSTAQTVTLTNSSTGPLTITAIAAPADFSASSNCPLSTSGTLAGGASCSINISFVPTKMGALAEQFTITDSASNSPQAIVVNGNGVAPVISVTPSIPTFDAQEVGTTGPPVTETVSNTGTAPLNISSIAIEKGWEGTFNITSSGTTCSASSQVLPGGSCTVNITFTPNVTFTMASWGGATAQLVVSSDALKGWSTASLSGTGYSGVATESPLSLDFGNVNVGQTSPSQTVTLTNSGSDSLYVKIISIAGNSGHFTETDNCPQMGMTITQPTPLAPGASCTVAVALDPTTAGPQTGTLLFADSAVSYSQSVTLSGTGSGPTVTASPGPISFGNQDMGSTSTPRTDTITNTGNTNLTFSSISITGSDSGDFTIPATGTTCSTSAPLAPNASCVIEVAFKPASTGSRNALLTIADNAYYTTQNFPLAGSGVDFALAVASGSSSSMTVMPGNSASESLTLTPEGGFNQTIAFTCAGAPSKATCTVSPNFVTLDGTNPQNVKVTVTTTAPSIAPPGPFSGPPPSGGLAINYWWIALLIMIGSLALAFRCRKRLPLLAGAVLIAALALSCGGGGGTSNTTTTPGTPAGTSTLTVTGTSSGLSHQTTVTLTVQ